MTRRRYRFFTYGRDTAQKEIQPAFPITICANGAESTVIFHLMALEEKAEIEERRFDEPPMLEQKCDHQTSDPPIAVEIGVDGFELHVQKAGPHKLRQPVVGMDVFLEGAEKPWELVGGRRNMDCVAGPASANPVLAGSKLARMFLAAAPLGEQDLVNFAEQSKR